MPRGIHCIHFRVRSISPYLFRSVVEDLNRVIKALKARARELVENVAIVGNPRLSAFVKLPRPLSISLVDYTYDTPGRAFVRCAASKWIPDRWEVLWPALRAITTGHADRDRKRGGHRPPRTLRTPSSRRQFEPIALRLKILRSF